MNHFERAFERIVLDRLTETPHFIQTILGPRQVGKTSGILNVLEKNFAPAEYQYCLCDSGINDQDWLAQQFQQGQIENKKILVFDEIQKIDNWSETVKLFWDKQKRIKTYHIVLLGSSSLQLSQGLSESLAGRFEVIPVFHWNYTESKFYKVEFDQYLELGGYPASYKLLSNPKRFRHYLLDSIIETVITRDILRFAQVKKPALFRQTFALACQHPAQEISYNKLLGQIQDAGNVDQIKYYLDLFAQAFLLRLIFKWTKTTMSRTSSPKLLPASPVFTSLFLNRPLTSEEKGRVFEAMVGNRLCEAFDQVCYWREGNFEVDYIVESRGTVFAIEVKTKKRYTSGIQSFKKTNPKTKVCFIDFQNYSKFEANPENFLEKYSI